MPKGPEYHYEYVLKTVDNSQLKQQSFTWNGSSIEDTKHTLARRDYDRCTVSYSKAMLLLILLGLFAILALGTYYIGVSIGYLGLALMVMLVIVVLILATAHEDVQ